VSSEHGGGSRVALSTATKYPHAYDDTVTWRVWAAKKAHQPPLPYGQVLNQRPGESHPDRKPRRAVVLGRMRSEPRERPAVYSVFALRATRGSSSLEDQTSSFSTRFQSWVACQKRRHGTTQSWVACQKRRGVKVNGVYYCYVLLLKQAARHLSNCWCLLLSSAPQVHNSTELLWHKTLDFTPDM